jgi:hypothetical protein
LANAVDGDWYFWHYRRHYGLRYLVGREIYRLRALEGNGMLQFMQQYGVFVAPGIGTVVCGWLLVAYAVAFWFSRRFSHLYQATLALLYMLFVLGFPFLFEGPLPAPFFVNHLGMVLIPAVMLWRRWYGVVAEPGYASARELLLLQRPLASPQAGNESAGLFVPLNVKPDTSPRFSWWSVLAAIGILGSIVVVMWLISLLEAAFSN